MGKHPPKRFKETGHSPGHTNPHTPQLLRKAIMDTLRYRKIFNCPMNYFQIWNYLIGGKNTIGGNLEKELEILVNEKKIIVKDGLYSLSKIDHEDAEKRYKRSKRLIAKAQHVTGFLKKIPWIDMVALTGSVAAFNAEEGHDIDVLIVTKPGRLFLSRFFVVLVLKTLGVYWDKKRPAGTICPNIFLSSDSLTWERSGQNLFTANEVALLYPLFQRHNCYFNFLKQNHWAAHYLPNLLVPDSHTRKPKKPTFTAKLVDLLELALRNIQLFYMKDKKTTEIVTDKLIHFNTHDSSEAVLQQYNRVHP